MKIGYYSKYKIGDKVRPIGDIGDSPEMTIDAICFSRCAGSDQHHRVTYSVVWWNGNAFGDRWVTEEQIKRA